MRNGLGPRLDTAPGPLTSPSYSSSIPRSDSTLGLASSVASKLWQALQSCVMESPILARMRAIVAAEAAGEVLVADVHGIRAPGDFHLRENVAVVYRQHFVGGCRDLRLALRPDGRVALLVILREGRGDLLPRPRRARGSAP